MSKKTILLLVIFGLLLVFAVGKVNAQTVGHTGLYIFGVTTINGTTVGVPAFLNLTVTNGTGEVFLGSTPLTGTDTQAQAVVSVDVACSLLNINCANYNFYYYISSSSAEVSGPSAGAAFAIAAMSILTNKPLKSGIAMTGTANPDGSMGIVGDVSEKSEAAADQGIKVFLYPSSDNISSAAVSYNQNHGMVAIPINSVYQAYNYFTGYNITPAISTNITTPIYQSLMKSTYEDFNVYQNGLYASLPQKNSTNSTIQSLISTASLQMSQEQSEAASGDYYTAASQMIATSAYLLEAKTLEELQSQANPTSFVSSLISEEESLVSATENNISSDYLTNSSTIILKFIALDRLQQAQDYLSSASSSLSSGNLGAVVFNYSLGAVKRETAYFWVSILPTGSSNFSQSSYENLSNYYLYKAASYSYYASLLGADVPAQLDQVNFYLNESQSRFQQGNYVASIFASIESISTADLVIEENSAVSNSTASNVISQINMSALRSINVDEASGITPFLGISYYTYGINFINTSISEYLLFESEARNFANLGQQISGALPVPYAPSLQAISIPQIPPSYYYTAAYIILGLAVGVAVGGLFYEYRLFRLVRLGKVKIQKVGQYSNIKNKKTRKPKNKKR